MIKPGDEPIPGYRVEALLGRGQFGQVWRARSPGGAEVALKFLELSGAHGWKEFRAIQRVKQIRHAHLMPIVATWLLDEQGQVLGDDAIESIASSHQETLAGAAPGDTLVAHPVAQSQRPAQLIVASLLADQSLCDRLKQCQEEGDEGIPVDDLLTFMGEAAKGLDFLNTTQHKIGQSTGAVQHCDVKPDNIMLSGGSVVIADFGVAQTLAQAQLDATATSLGGTPAYMAPELFVNKPSRSSDQYSLAVTYYELRTGRLPFVEHTYAAVYQAHREGKLDFSACKPAEQEVLRRATATNPEQRFKSCTEFIDALAASARPKAKGAEARSQSKAPALAAATVILLLLAAIGYGAYRWNDTGTDTIGNIVQLADEGEYKSAVSLFETLSNVEHVKEALAKSERSFGRASSQNDPDIKAHIKLLSILRHSSWSKELTPETYKTFRDWLAHALEERLDNLRTSCTEWDPKDRREAISDKLADSRKSLKDLLADGMQSNVEECETRAPAFELQSIRIDAREDRENWPGLQERTTKIDGDELPPVDVPYLGALSFIFDDWDVTNIDGVESGKRVQRYIAVKQEFDAAKVGPGPWELHQMKDRLREIGIDPEYLSVYGARELQLARSDRLKLRFDRARTFAKSGLAAAEGDEQLTRDLQDEYFAIDLVDPSTPLSVVHQRLAEASVVNLETWARVADKIVKDHDLDDVRNVDAKKIDPGQAGLVAALRWECYLSGVGGHPLTANEALTLEKLLRLSPYADYGHYVRGVSASRDATEFAGRDSQLVLWNEASQRIRDAYKARRADSLLTAPFRTAKARDVLEKAVLAWSNGKPPTDDEFGDAGAFGGLVEDALECLILARKLDPAAQQPDAPPVPRDAWLMAAATAKWDLVDEQCARELLPLAEGLIQRSQSNSVIRRFLGTINFAAAKARLTIEPTSFEALPSVAGALEHLYLNPRLGKNYEGKPPTPQRLEKIKSAIVDPVLHLAEAAWEESEIAGVAPSATLGKYFQAAGLLLREEHIAEQVKYRPQAQNPDDLAYAYLHRANQVIADPTSLIEEARALEGCTRPPADRVNQMGILADRAVALAEQVSLPLVQRSAWALQAYVRLAQARVESETTARRNAVRSQALDIINKAINADTPLNGQPTDYADWLITRSAIYVDDANLGDLDFGSRRDRLISAAKDAEAASKSLSRKHHEYAFLAWGNALEDLAFYVFDDPERNYNAAMDKFTSAVEASHPLRWPGGPSPPSGVQVEWRGATHIPAFKSLMRCRIHKAVSGVLATPSDEIVELTLLIDDANEEFGFLVGTGPSSAAGIDPRLAFHTAELLFWLSEAHRNLAERLPVSEQTAQRLASENALMKAIAWAQSASSWDSWAAYQCSLAKRRDEARDFVTAARLCDEVLAAEREQQIALSHERLFEAANLLLTIRSKASQPLSDAEWNNLIDRFPADGSPAARFHAELLIQRVTEPNRWNEAAGHDIDAVMATLEAANPKSAKIAILSLDWRTLTSFKSHGISEEPPAENAVWPARLVDVGAALVKFDDLLPNVLGSELVALKSGDQQWDGLERWQRTALRKHLVATAEARMLFVFGAAELVVRTDLPTVTPQIKADVRAQGQQEYQLLRTEFSTNYLPESTFEEVKAIEPKVRENLFR